MSEMWKCEDCGHVFSEPDVVKGGFDHAFGFFSEKVDVCPNCGSEDLEAAVPCGNAGYINDGRGCNNYVLENDAPASSPYVQHIFIAALCDECREAFHEKLHGFLNSLSDAELAALDDMLNGVSVFEVKENLNDKYDC